MTGHRTVYLMYHELQVPGRSLCRDDPGYTRYVIPAADFRVQLEHLHSLGLRGMSVGQALEGEDGDRPGVVITFDDGCESDLLAAAPPLREFGFRATFYVVAGFVGRPGFLSPGQIREMADQGLEIGCHSMTHAYLGDLSDRQLQVEVVQAKEKLEQLTGRAIQHFSCPGGRWSRHVAQVARGAGYQSVATSRLGVNSPASDRFQLARLAIRQGLTLAEFDSLARGRHLWINQVQQGMLAAAKGLLGNLMYDLLRSVVLGES